jgi:ankyrin repeat protein
MLIASITFLWSNDLNSPIKNLPIMPLHYYAIYGNYEEFVKAGIQGADMNIKDLRYGKTPLMYAVDQNILINKSNNEGKYKIAIYLLEHNADVKVKAFDNSNVLHWAIKSKNLKIIKKLIKAGVDINGVDSEGVTPLSLAILLEYEKVVKILKENGAKLTNYNKAGIAFNNSNYAKAFHYYKLGCDNKDALSCAGLSVFYKKGINVKKDCIKSIDYSKKACNYNDGMSCAQVGLEYILAGCVKSNIIEANKYLNKGCRLGFQKACNFLESKR